MIDLGTKRLETERLILRKIKLSDYKKAYKNWCSEKEVPKHLPWEVHESEEVTKKLYDAWVKEYEQPYKFRWIVIEKESDEPIGTIDVVNFKDCDSRAEIGYCYGTKWWGKGYATEALKAVLNYLMNEVKIEMITCGYSVTNPASGKVMEKAGMKYAFTMPKWIINKEGKREDLKYYVMYNNEQ